jgi:hypothetical protein
MSQGMEKTMSTIRAIDSLENYESCAVGRTHDWRSRSTSASTTPTRTAGGCSDGANA